MRFRDPLVVLVLFAVPAALAACDKASEKPSTPANAVAHEEHKAPHGGAILELGEEAAHVEVVHDAASGTLTVYVLDKDVKTPLRVAAPTIVLASSKGSQDVVMTAVNAAADGTADTWKTTHDGLKTDPLNGRIRLTVRGAPFQSPLEPEGHK